MRFEDLALLSRRDRVRLAVLLVILIALAIWASFHFLQPAPPRRIVLASGAESGAYHYYARQYIQALRQEGVTVEERLTNGAIDNLQLLLDPASGVDVAFMQGGVASSPAADDLVMLASLYYEPLWIFYRDPATLSRINELQGKRMAIGVPGSGTRAWAEQMLDANGLVVGNGAGRGNTEIVGIGGDDAIRALQAGAIDAAFFVGGSQTAAVQAALRDPAIKLMSLSRAAAYPRKFPYLTRLTLPPGTIDFAANVPDREIQMIATKAMLVARDGIHPALVSLLLDAARDIHGAQGAFEAAGEFPGTARVDLQVSPYADQHRRFGRSFLYRYLPFWVASFVERAIIVLVPLIVIVVPVVNYLPAFMRWRVRSRIYRWYGELALLERDVATRKDALPIEKWLEDLDRIQGAVEGLRTPNTFASEAYTLREHVALVRRTVLAKGGERPAPTG